MIEKIGHYSLENTASVYDEEAMTALELAGRTAQKVNEVIQQSNTLDADTRSWMQDVSNQQIPAEVKAEILRHIESGDFDRAIDLYMGSLQAQVDNLTGSYKEGSTTMDAEVIDARLGENGTTYDTLGYAIREQMKLSWKRARNHWRNSNRADALVIDSEAKTVTVKAGASIQGVYSRTMTGADTTFSWSGLSDETYAIVLNSATLQVYMTQMSQNFENHTDFLLCYMYLYSEVPQRIWADAGAEKFIQVNGAPLSEVSDARTGANGLTYNSLGIALREQFNLSWKRSRNIWRNAGSSTPCLIVDTSAKTVTLKGGTTIQGLYSYTPVSATTSVSWAELGDNTFALALNTVTQNLYMVLTTSNFENPGDYLLAHIYLNGSNFGRMWADAGVEKLISVDGVQLCDINTKGYTNKHTANIFRKVVCIGDSLTSGHMTNVLTGATVARNEEFAYPRFMEKLTGNTYINCGVSGATVHTWQTSDMAQQAVNAGQAQAYIIRFMGNDYNSSMEVGTIADAESDTATSFIGGYGQIIRKMKAVSPHAKFFICTDARTGDRWDELNQAVYDIANYFDNVYCIDVLKKHTLYGGINVDSLDGHYTATGYEMMAEFYHHCICEIIYNNPTDFQSVPFIPYTV